MRSPPIGAAPYTGRMTTPAAALPRRKLPIGLQTLAKLREDDCYDVDKSGLACDLVESGRHPGRARLRRRPRTPHRLGVRCVKVIELGGPLAGRLDRLRSAARKAPIVLLPYSSTTQAHT